jgi:cytosine permease
MADRLSRFTSAMDRLYEFDREPVSADKLQSGGKFAGLFAGEHVAATEFVIGAFFVLHGVPARDLILGLLFGNLLAVLSWTFVCAPIAARRHLLL